MFLFHVVGHFADDRGVRGVFPFPESFHDLGSDFLGREDDEASFAGQIKRFQTEHAADTGNLGRDRNIGRVQADTDMTANGLAGRVFRTRSLLTDSSFVASQQR